MSEEIKDAAEIKDPEEVKNRSGEKDKTFRDQENQNRESS